MHTPARRTHMHDATNPVEPCSSTSVEHASICLLYPSGSHHTLIALVNTKYDMTEQTNTAVLDLSLSLDNGETEQQVVEHKVTSKWIELEELLSVLAKAPAGSEYTEDMVDTLTWGRNTARRQGQAYTTSYGHAGFTWGNKEGRYTCTKNADENKLYVNFMTWEALKADKEQF